METKKMKDEIDLAFEPKENIIISGHPR